MIRANLWFLWLCEQDKFTKIWKCPNRIFRSVKKYNKNKNNEHENQALKSEWHKQKQTNKKHVQKQSKQKRNKIVLKKNVERNKTTKTVLYSIETQNGSYHVLIFRKNLGYFWILTLIAFIWPLFYHQFQAQDCSY